MTNMKEVRRTSQGTGSEGANTGESCRVFEVMLLAVFPFDCDPFRE